MALLAGGPGDMRPAWGTGIGGRHEGQAAALGYRRQAWETYGEPGGHMAGPSGQATAPGDRRWAQGTSSSPRGHMGGPEDTRQDPGEHVAALGDWRKAQGTGGSRLAWVLEQVGLHQVVEDVVLTDSLHRAAAGGTQ